MQKFLKNNAKNKGFTLIELIVVVAIIALLVTIVAVNTVSTRNKAKNQVIQTNLNTLRAAGILWSNNTGSYAGFCADNDCNLGSDDWKRICSAIKIQNGNGNVSCSTISGTTAWCASARLAGSSDHYCVDVSGKSQEQAGACSGGACD